jgi:hypothetical protein
MQADGVVPDEYIVKALDFCFRDIPTLGQEISKEACALMDPKQLGSESQNSPHVFVLDLHYMSVPTARVAILQVTWPPSPIPQ